jgi:hypothetical protein
LKLVHFDANSAITFFFSFSSEILALDFMPYSKRSIIEDISASILSLQVNLASQTVFFRFAM